MPMTHQAGKKDRERLRRFCPSGLLRPPCTVRLASTLWSLLAILLGSACSNSDIRHHDAWQRYTSSLGRILARTATSPAPTPALLPHAAQLTLSVSTNEINLLEFLQLQRCALQQTLADKNSILGRHSDAAAQLVFTLRFLNEVDACTSQMKAAGNKELTATLQAAKTAKHRQLPRQLANALLAGPEYRALWHSPAQQRQPYPPQQQDSAVRALQRWQQLQTVWLQGRDYHLHAEVLGLLNDIRRGLGGELLIFQGRALQGLQQANALLAQRISGRALCLNGSPTAQAKRYQAVLHRRFVGDIQPLAARANRHQQALMKAVHDIEATLDDALRPNGAALPGNYQQWRVHRDALLTEVLLKHRQHVALNSQLLKQCGLAGSTP